MTPAEVLSSTALCGSIPKLVSEGGYLLPGRSGFPQHSRRQNLDPEVNLDRKLSSYALLFESPGLGPETQLLSCKADTL